MPNTRPMSWATIVKWPTPPNVCGTYWASHGCSRRGGHKGRCKCSCGVIKRTRYGFR